jgi:UDP-N-acetylmuramate dehydrogenase
MKKNVLNAITQLKLLLGEKRVLVNEPLKKHTSIKIGGSCTALVEPTTEQELTNVLTLFLIHKVRFFVIGIGTNLLVIDEGVYAFIV